MYSINLFTCTEYKLLMTSMPALLDVTVTFA